MSQLFRVTLFQMEQTLMLVQMYFKISLLNPAIGNSAAGGTYGLTTGSGNAMVGYNSRGSCQTGSHITFLGSNTEFKGTTYLSGPIALGGGAVVNGYNQLMVASNYLF